MLELIGDLLGLPGWFLFFLGGAAAPGAAAAVEPACCKEEPCGCICASPSAKKGAEEAAAIGIGLEENNNSTYGDRRQAHTASCLMTLCWLTSAAGCARLAGSYDLPCWTLLLSPSSVSGERAVVQFTERRHGRRCVCISICCLAPLPASSDF